MQAGHAQYGRPHIQRGAVGDGLCNGEHAAAIVALGADRAAGGEQIDGQQQREQSGAVPLQGSPGVESGGAGDAPASQDATSAWTSWGVRGSVVENQWMPSSRRNQTTCRRIKPWVA